jgi:hypothetical protein
MRIVHISGKVIEEVKPPRKKDKQLESAMRWADIQYQRSFDQFLKDYASEIEEIQKTYPDWKPIKKTGRSSHRPVQ